MPSSTARSASCLIVSLACALSPLSAGADVTADKSLSPYFHIENGEPGVDLLPLNNTSVDVNVTGVIADVTVEQVYENKGPRPISARYVFPASTRAAVYGMTMTVGDEVVRAKIKEKEEAKKEYEEAKAAGKNASLLEQERPNVFSMRVSNIQPGQTIKVELSYTEHLVPDGGVYEFVYPTVVGPRFSEPSARSADGGAETLPTPYTQAGASPAHSLSLKGRVAAGVPIRTLESPSHKLSSEQNAMGATFALATAEAHGGDRDFILRYRLAGDDVQSGLMLFEGANEKFFLLTVQPPKRVEPWQIPPREYVFVIDVSGSMGGFPLDTAKSLMRDLLGNIRPSDRFNVILFSGDAQVMSPSSVPATPENIARAEEVIDNQRGGGGTYLLQALKTALAMPAEKNWARSFVVITDGYINADREAMAYVKAHVGEANLFSFGIGSGVNRFLVEGLAKAGLGQPFVAENEAAAARQAELLRKYIEKPVLTNVRVETEGFQAYGIEPASLPDVLADRPVVVFGKWAGERTGTITVRGIGGKSVYEQTFDVATVAADPKNSALRYLWARSRLSELSDFHFGEGHTDAERKEIVDLGLTYNLLTRYTSFIAVREKIVGRGDTEDVEHPQALPAGVSDQALGMEVGTEPELIWLSVLLLLGAVFITRRQRGRVAR